MSGWIKTHRSKLCWEWFTDYKTSHLFEYLLLRASHNNYRWRGVIYNAGQLPFGLEKASADTGLSIKMIRTSLSKLKSTNEVAIKTSNKGSVITILNWDKYQVEANKGASKGQARGKLGATTKNEKNEKNEKNGSFSETLITLFDDLEIITWLKDTGTKKLQIALISEYDHDVLANEIAKAYYWCAENKKKRKAGIFLKTWMENCNTKDKYNSETIKNISLKFLADCGLYDEDSIITEKGNNDTD